MAQKILVTGGAGFIGSHTVLELLNAGYEVVVVDNLSNSSEESLVRVRELTGKSVTFVKADLLDRAALKAAFVEHKPKSVIHFAGLKAVGDSVRVPLSYYHNNITGTVILLEVMAETGCKNIVFSSSATVYGIPEKLPLDESAKTGATNPYGRTKLFIEEILHDLFVSDPEWRIIVLRYFNPVGAHVSGRIGEDPKGTPNNLMPFVSQVAVGKRPFVSVFGSDYDTPDGTGVRDYIHVVDLALGHLRALTRIDALSEKGAWEAINLGTGNGYSVLEMIRAMEKASGRKIEYKLVGRRDGDVASVWAECTKAEKLLSWKATRNLDDMCTDLWRWQSANPNGFN